MNILRLPFVAFAYFSVATVLAEAGLLGAMWRRGYLTEDALVQVLAVANDVDLEAMRLQAEAEARAASVHDISYDEVRRHRTLANLDLDLQEVAAEKGLLDIQQLNDDLGSDWKQYNALWQAFNEERQQLQEGAADLGLQDVRTQLETVSARLAKDQIIRLLETEATDADTALQFVVMVFKDMPIEKRKKLLPEFKAEAEQDHLHEILRQIRLGVPDVQLIRETREALQRLDSTKQGGSTDDANSA